MLISWYSYNQTGGTTEGTRDVAMARPDRDWSEPHIHVNGIDEVLADLARYTKSTSSTTGGKAGTRKPTVNDGNIKTGGLFLFDTHTR